MSKFHVLLCIVSCVLISCSSCSMQPKAVVEAQMVQHSELAFSVQSVVDECTNPHEVYGFPAQPIPGIPVMIMRHGECLGQPNMVIAIWPGSNSKVNLLYVSMMIEKYIEHLRFGNEFFEAKLVATGNVVISEIDDTGDTVPTYAAVFKLAHIMRTGSKNSHKKIPTD